MAGQVPCLDSQLRVENELLLSAVQPSASRGPPGLVSPDQTSPWVQRAAQVDV